MEDTLHVQSPWLDELEQSLNPGMHTCEAKGR